jgi:alpha-methylacyl-CoA racemase
MGPLAGVRIIEFGGVGPGPYACMLLSDMGADVVRIDRKTIQKVGDRDFRRTKYDLANRNRRSVVVDLKQPEGIEACLELVATADALVEGFRPGVMERLGLGPDDCLARNPKLVYGRMTGWGQSGPLANTAGHDINYIALTGALHSIGATGGPPVPPLNLVGDYGGGAMFLVCGILAGLFEAQRSGRGQIVDAAMTDGSASLMTLFHGLSAFGAWSPSRGENMLDGGAHFYSTYETRDGKWIAVGAVEGPFYRELRRALGLHDPAFDAQMSADRWPELKQKLAEIFKTRTQAEWISLIGDADACCTPVLSLQEAIGHPHNVARNTFVEVDGVTQPNVAPRFSRTPSSIRWPSPKHGAHTREVMAEAGYSDAQLDALAARNVIDCAD